VLLAAGVAVVDDPEDPRIREHGRVEVGRGLGLPAESKDKV